MRPHRRPAALPSEDARTWPRKTARRGSRRRARRACRRRRCLHRGYRERLRRQTRRCHRRSRCLDRPPVAVPSRTWRPVALRSRSAAAKQCAMRQARAARAPRAALLLLPALADAAPAGGYVAPRRRVPSPRASGGARRVAAVRLPSHAPPVGARPGNCLKKKGCRSGGRGPAVAKLARRIACGKRPRRPRLQDTREHTQRTRSRGSARSARLARRHTCMPTAPDAPAPRIAIQHSQGIHRATARASHVMHARARRTGGDATPVARAPA